MLMHQMIDQHARAGTGLTIDEAQASPDQIGKGADQCGMFPSDHQTLHAARTADELLPARLEQGLQSPREHGRGPAQRRYVETRHEALSVVKTTQRIAATLK